MDRNAYMTKVLAQLRHVTGEERAAIRAEIDGHMEDHICALLDLGYDQALAEERTLAAMGDPAEVGRELNKQYPLGWLVLGRLAAAMTVVLGLILVLGLPLLGNLFSSAAARLSPERHQETRLETVTGESWMDLRYPAADDILRVYRVAVGQWDGERVAEVFTVNYDPAFWGVASKALADRVTLENQRGERLGRGGGSSDSGSCWRRLYAELEPEDTYVTLRYERFGERLELRLSLPEEVTP